MTTMKGFLRTSFTFVVMLCVQVSIPHSALADESNSVADPITARYCDLPAQRSADGRMIKPYPVAVIDLQRDEEQTLWAQSLMGCEGTTYVIIRSHLKNDRVSCSLEEGGGGGHCFFHIDYSSLSYQSIIEFSVQDDGGWAYKIQACPRSNLIVATGFYRFEYLGGSHDGSAHRGRHVMVDPARAEATWAAIGDSCFDFGDFGQPDIGSKLHSIIDTGSTKQYAFQRLKALENYVAEELARSRQYPDFYGYWTLERLNTALTTLKLLPEHFDGLPSCDALRERIEKAWDDEPIDEQSEPVPLIWEAVKKACK